MGALTSEALGRLTTWVARRMARDGTPGLSLAITGRYALVHASGHGLADVAAGTPVTPAHLFETGSIGKSFTAVALLRLAEEGLVDVQAPVTDYLPWFSVRSDHEPIRLHHLLTHTAGITSGIDGAPAGAIQVWALRDAVATTPPGTYFHYSNVGYKVLGEVLRAVTGESYGDTIHRLVLDPLGLVDSVPTITTDVRPRLAVGYGPMHDDRPWWPGRPLAPATWLETDTADGCLAMTAADLAAYLRMLLGHGVADGRHLLSEEGFALLTQRAIPTDEPPVESWYGYGVETTIVDGRTRVGHGGGMVGYFAGMIGDLASGIGAVALVNGPGAPNLIARTALAFAVAEAEGTPFAFPDLDDPEEIDGAADFAGDYVAVEGRDGPSRLSIVADGPALTVAASGAAPGAAAPIRSDDPDELLTAAPGLDRFPIRFRRDGGQSIRQATYGDTVYVPAGAPAHEPVDPPADQAAYPGHYRSHNPWTPSIRVLLRQGRLWLSIAAVPDGLQAEQPLVPIADGKFRAGDDPRIPERIRFDVLIDGRTHVAHLSGCDFYRVNEP